MSLQIIYHIEDTWSAETSYINIKVDFATIEKLQLDVTMEDIERAIVSQKKLKISPLDVKILRSHMRIYVRGAAGDGTRVGAGRASPKDDPDIFSRVTHLKRILPSLVIRGYPDALRAVIKTDDNTSRHSLVVEGYGLRACMSTEGVVGRATRTNSVMETREVLGIEAARRTIIDEINSVMGDMDIDPRHMQLLADVMTYKGEILGITRFGLAKMRDSVLQLASFEKTPDHLFEAAFHMKKDRIEGVSECIIMGQSMGVGTGAFRVVRRLGLADGDVKRKATVFEDCWKVAVQARRRSTAVT